MAEPVIVSGGRLNQFFNIQVTLFFKIGKSLHKGFAYFAFVAILKQDSWNNGLTRPLDPGISENRHLKLELVSFFAKMPGYSLAAL